MANENGFDMLYSPSNGTEELKKFSDELLNKFKGKVIEIYIGDQYECLNFDDYSQQQNATIYGKLVDVLDRFLILDCYYVDTKTNEVKSNNIIYLNTFQIKAMSELNDNGSLDDIFLSAKHASKIKKILLNT